jgi:hypothetical protein
MFHELLALFTWINSNKQIWHKIQLINNILLKDNKNLVNFKL